MPIKKSVVLSFAIIYSIEKEDKSISNLNPFGYSHLFHDSNVLNVIIAFLVW